MRIISKGLKNLLCGAVLASVTALSSMAQSAPVGWLYTTTNDPEANQVLRIERYADGTLGGEMAFATGGKGVANHDAPANGDYDAQYQMQIIDDILLVTNAGDSRVSSFRINAQDGTLTHLENVDTKGDFPATIAMTPVVGMEGQYWIAIGNQWGQPTVLYDGDALRRYPSDEWHQGDLSAADPSDARRSVELYKLDISAGQLTPIGNIDHYSRENGGPASIAFSPDGRKLAVSTWGIPHFLAEDPILEETHPSRVYVYDFDNGSVSNRRYFQEPGIIGSVGFDWSKDSDLIYLSNFNIINAKADNGLIVLRDDGSSLSKVGNYVTGAGTTIDEACWTALSADYSRLYVVSFVTNEISIFDLDPDTGMVTGRRALVERQGDLDAESDAKDVALSADGQYLYWLGSLATYTVSSYRVTDAGLDFVTQYVTEATKDGAGNIGQYDLGGIALFDKK